MQLNSEGFARKRVASPATEHSSGRLPGFWTLHPGWLHCCDELEEVHLQASGQAGQQLFDHRFG